MPSAHFVNKTIRVWRLSNVSGYKDSYTDLIAIIKAYVQKITDESTFHVYGVLGATHKAWCGITSDIQEGDRAIDSDDIEYEVVAINKKDFGSLCNQHIEVILKKYDD